MRIDQSSHQQFQREKRFADDTDGNTDYKGDIKQTCVEERHDDPTSSSKKIFQVNMLHCFRLHQSETSQDGCGKNSVVSRFSGNDEGKTMDESQYYLNQSKNFRDLERDNNTCALLKSDTMKSTSASRRVRFSPFWMQLTIIFVLTSFILLTSNVYLVNSCNEAVCASIVSKCTLTQACKCELKNCSCCKECFDCLTYLYDECCSCVELCPKPNISHHVIMHSQVGDLKEPIDELFRALTEEKDIQGRWATFTYPIDIDQSWFMPKPEAASSANVYTVANGKIVVDSTKEVVTVNCTVAYMSECMPLNKCKNSCHSMGASYFRWFHDGCCECIGSTCINYGIDESRCSKCSMEDDAEDDPMESEAQDDTENDTGKES